MPFRDQIIRVLDDPRFERAIMALIIFNAITLGMETSPTIMGSYGGIITAIDRIVLGIFVIEIAVRLYARGWSFWRDPWRVFDFCVVAIALVPATGSFSVLRAFRILRVLRLISAVPAIRRVIVGLLNAIPGMGSIVLLLGLIFYIFSVMATKLFGADFPEWFGSIGDSAYTLFQIMTLESWSMGIVRPVMEVYPYAWAFFLPFILSTAFTVLNLFIGIIVDAMQSQHQDEAHDEREALKKTIEELMQETRAMRQTLNAHIAASAPLK